MTSLPVIEFLEEGPYPLPADQQVSSWALGDQGEWVHAWFTPFSRLVLLLPRLASFSFSSLESPVLCRVEPDVDQHVAFVAYCRAVLPIILQYSGVEVLHASAVAAPAGAVLFCGRSGTGKSTTAREFAKRGFRLLADDASAWRVGETGAEMCVLPPFSKTPQHSCEALPIRAVVVLERTTEPGTEAVEFAEADELHGARAITTLIPHAVVAEIEGKSETDMVCRYADLVRTMPIFHIRFRPDASRIPDFIDFLRGRLRLDEAF